jgi:hypothetical protein
VKSQETRGVLCPSSFLSFQYYVRGFSREILSSTSEVATAGVFHAAATLSVDVLEQIDVRSVIQGLIDPLINNVAREIKIATGIGILAAAQNLRKALRSITRGGIEIVSVAEHAVCCCSDGGK